MSRLLLIDDEADVQYSFQRIFDAPEIELTTASSGEEALRIIPKLKPDLVMMDVRMGGMTGLETLRRIRQIEPKLLVILMTAYGTTQMAIEAMKLGAYDYLLKPFDVPKLKEIVHKDFYNLSPVADQLVGYNACFFCLGVSSVGMKESDYFHLTHTLTLHVAEILSFQNPGMCFCYISVQAQTVLKKADSCGQG